MFPTISFFIAGLIVLAAIYLSYTTDIIKSPTTSDAPSIQKKYSFARTQLMWWTVIISGCFIIMFGEIGSFALNQTVMILLGIGVATTTAGSMIDTSQAQTAAEKGTLRHQDSKNVQFFRDLLDDGNGISTHRFQALLFNILFGIIFIAFFFNHSYKFPDFDDYQLGTMGISSAAYLALKTNENKTPSTQVKAQQAINNTNNPAS